MFWASVRLFFCYISLDVYDPGRNIIIFIFSSSRYHNGRRLPKLTVGMRSSLFIANVSGAQGLYTCKATNDYGSEMSSAGELKIKGNTTFSTVALSSNSQRQAWRKHGVPQFSRVFIIRLLTFSIHFVSLLVFKADKKRWFVNTFIWKFPITSKHFQNIRWTLWCKGRIKCHFFSCLLVRFFSTIQRLL